MYNEIICCKALYFRGKSYCTKIGFIFRVRLQAQKGYKDQTAKYSDLQ